MINNSKLLLLYLKKNLNVILKMYGPDGKTNSSAFDLHLAKVINLFI